MPTAPTNTTTKKASAKAKKASAKAKKADPLEDLEPLSPIFGDEDDGEEEEAPPLKAKPARHVGSLLGDNGAPKPKRAVASEPDEDDAPESDDDVQVEDAPETPASPKTPHAAAIYWQEAKRVGPAHAKAALLRKLGERLKQHESDVHKWGDNPIVANADALLIDAMHKVADAARCLEELPLGWSPPAKPAAGGPKTLTEGTKVSIKESARKEYDGVLEPKEMVGLSVVRHETGKPKVACKTAEGSRVVIPRAHLVIDATETAEMGEDDA